MVFHVFEATVPPPPRPDNKARRGYYTRSVLCDAVKQAIFGTMTVTEAARYYKIPRTTIQKHVRSIISARWKPHGSVSLVDAETALSADYPNQGRTMSLAVNKFVLLTL
ncbi:unnamed protein product [Strongylus vulgaris]|uniref:HTH psq-type domain-containing protein n=1 Tax=Strongylus vulgaris TaxID=40348 RepID=A0A3P7IGB2_STRVU|nr:unnamed protein product [Strongylus vulgaris]